MPRRGIPGFMGLGKLVANESPTLSIRLELRTTARSDTYPGTRVGVDGCQEVDRGRSGVQGREIAI